jgi:hypothetical protein
VNRPTHWRLALPTSGAALIGAGLAIDFQAGGPVDFLVGSAAALYAMSAVILGVWLALLVIERHAEPPRKDEGD